MKRPAIRKHRPFAAAIAPPAGDFGTPEWQQALAGVAQSIGHAGFEARLSELLGTILHVDHCVVFTFTESEGPQHLFTRGRIPQEEAEELARDYVGGYYKRDPHFAEASALDGTAETRPFRPQLKNEYDPDYRDRFFDRHQLVDKISTVGRAGEGNVYCNFWRMRDSGPFSDREEELLNSVLPLLTGLISAHYRCLRVKPGSMHRGEAPAARTLIHSVISRGTPPFGRLTRREAEICERILLGYTSTGISLDLGIAVSSVNTYRRRAYEKLGIATQNELFSMCLEALNRAGSFEC